MYLGFDAKISSHSGFCVELVYHKTRLTKVIKAGEVAPADWLAGWLAKYKLHDKTSYHSGQWQCRSVIVGMDISRHQASGRSIVTILFVCFRAKTSREFGFWVFHSHQTLWMLSHHCLAAAVWRITKPTVDKWEPAPPVVWSGSAKRTLLGSGQLPGRSHNAQPAQPNQRRPKQNNHQTN